MKLQKYANEEIALQLKKEGRFEIEKYELVNSKLWSKEFEIMHIKDIRQALKRETPSLADIRKYRGMDIIHRFLCKIIAEFVLNFNVKMNMNPEQIEDAARKVYSEFHAFNLADFKLCFNNVIMGVYGPVYGRIDVSVLCGWINKYADERFTISQQKSEEESRLRKEGKFEKDMEVDKEGLKKLGKMRQGLLDKNKIKERKKDLSRDKKLEGQREANELMNGRKEFTEEEKAAMKKRAEEIDKMLNK